MKKALKIGGGVLAALVVVVFGGLQVAQSKTRSLLEEPKWADVKGVDVPVPWPLSEEEKNALREAKKQELAAKAAAAAQAGAGEAAPAQPADADPLAGVDLGAIAKERALARGKHLLESRVGCTECHGMDFGGKVIIDAPPMGLWAGPNITSAGVTKDYKPSDWDRIVRHGIAKDHTSTTMPAIDFATLSDRDLSDLIATITSMPAVDRPSIENKMGPVRAMLYMTGGIPVSAELIDHAMKRPELPPAEAVNVEFGKHVAQSCVGCHRLNYSGGPVPGGDPKWAPAANLTPDASGLKGWTAEEFKRALREGKSKDGRELAEPMRTVVMGTKNMTDVEIDAMFAFLQSLPATPKDTPNPTK